MTPFAPVYQSAVERALALGELDPFAFSLAEALGMTIEQIQDSMSIREYLGWRAFNVWRNAQQELAFKSARAERHGR